MFRLRLSIFPVHDVINVLFQLLILGLVTLCESYCLYPSWHSFYQMFERLFQYFSHSSNITDFSSSRFDGKSVLSCICL